MGAMALIPLGLADVEGPSMVPTLRDGDVVLVWWGGRPRPGAVVVLRVPGAEGTTAVKRISRRTPAGWEVLGDNPLASTDSRHYGAVARTAILGRVLLRVRPWGRLSRRSR